MNFGGLVLQADRPYNIRVMDLLQPDSVAVRWYPDGLYLGTRAYDDVARFINQKTMQWYVRDNGDNSFSLQSTTGKWITSMSTAGYWPTVSITANDSPFYVTTDANAAAKFVAASAGSPDIGILRLKDTSESDNSFCGVTWFYDMESVTYVPDVSFGMKISQGGQMVPGAYWENFIQRLRPRKLNIESRNSIYFEDKVRQINETKFRLLFS